MQINLLKNLVEEMAGIGTGTIVDILFEKEDVNEFLIAKKMDLTINQVRNILYKLSAEGLVSFTRKKDKKKGWYIYFWTLNKEKCLKKIEGEYVRKMTELKQVLSDRETKRYYICKGCNIEATEEKALESDFSCDECTEVYELVDNTNAIRDIKGKITKKENELKEIRTELEIEKERLDKKKSKKNAAASKKEAKGKAKAKLAKAAAKGKVVKKIKPVKSNLTSRKPLKAIKNKKK
jgi:transcription factor E